MDGVEEGGGGRQRHETSHRQPDVEPRVLGDKEQPTDHAAEGRRHSRPVQPPPQAPAEHVAGRRQHLARRVPGLIPLPVDEEHDCRKHPPGRDDQAEEGKRPITPVPHRQPDCQRGGTGQEEGETRRVSSVSSPPADHAHDIGGRHHPRKRGEHSPAPERDGVCHRRGDRRHDSRGDRADHRSNRGPCQPVRHPDWRPHDSPGRGGQGPTDRRHGEGSAGQPGRDDRRGRGGAGGEQPDRACRGEERQPRRRTAGIDPEEEAGEVHERA